MSRHVRRRRRLLRVHHPRPGPPRRYRRRAARADRLQRHGDRRLRTPRHHHPGHRPRPVRRGHPVAARLPRGTAAHRIRRLPLRRLRCQAPRRAPGRRDRILVLLAAGVLIEEAPTPDPRLLHARQRVRARHSGRPWPSPSPRSPVSSRPSSTGARPATPTARSRAPLTSPSDSSACSTRSSSGSRSKPSRRTRSSPRLAPTPPGCSFSAITTFVGGWAADLMHVFIVTSVLGLTARLPQRDQPLRSRPRRRGHPAQGPGPRPSAPRLAPTSRGDAQIVLGAVVVLAFAAAGADPYGQLLLLGQHPA